MKLKLYLKKVYRKLKEFHKDEWGGNLVEYALLIGFALFIFFIIVGMVTGMLDWVQDLVTDFSELFG
jgi:Flp pilus assembly pilin Flp